MSSHSPTHSGLAQRDRGGFTLVELILGMALTAIVVGALAAFSLSLSQAWAYGATDAVADGSGESTPAKTTLADSINQYQSVLRVGALLRAAKLIGLVRPGVDPPTTDPAAAVMLWMSDRAPVVDGLGTVDHQIQLSEIGLIQYDADVQTLWLYRCVNPATDYTWTYADALCSAKAPEDFRVLANQRVALARRVTAARFAARSIDGKSGQPALDFTLTFRLDGRNVSQCGTATLRAADFAPMDN